MNSLDEAARRRAVDFAVRLAAGTPLAPDTYEVALLEQYVLGHLSLPQLMGLTEEYQGTKKAPTPRAEAQSRNSK